MWFIVINPLKCMQLNGTETFEKFPSINENRTKIEIVPFVS